MIFENLLAKQFFKVHFLFVTFDIMLGRHSCLTQSSDVVRIHKYFLQFHSEQRLEISIINNIN